VVAYPQLRIMLEKMNDLLKKNPKDPTALTDRAGLLLDQGKLEQAAGDLRTALANKPPPYVQARARAKLFEALTELLQRDFKAAEKYLKDYEEVSKVEMPPDADPE